MPSDMYPTPCRVFSTRKLFIGLCAGLSLLLSACGGQVNERSASSTTPAQAATPGAATIAPSAPPLNTSLEIAIQEITQQLHDQKLAYDGDSKKRRDCSGIFHEALLQLQNRCPGVKGPGFTEARSSASIYNWYQGRDELFEIDDPLASTGLLQPGAALFYKRPRENRPTHMGIVVDLQHHADGSLKGYRLFHGRRPGKPAAITSYHYVKPRNDEPLGVGDKRWIATAYLCPGASCACSDQQAQQGSQSTGQLVASAGDSLYLAANTEQSQSPTPAVIARGTASYYHPSLEGNFTANGEIYDHSGMTAAHRTLPFGTVLRVTREDTGRSVVVRVNDRGPYAPNRIIDLSGGAANELGMLRDGLAQVRLERVE